MAAPCLGAVGFGTNAWDAERIAFRVHSFLIGAAAASAARTTGIDPTCVGTAVRPLRSGPQQPEPLATDPWIASVSFL